MMLVEDPAWTIESSSVSVPFALLVLPTFNFIQQRGNLAVERAFFYSKQ
jgi:hypothetical protein